jgi:peptidyl-prolyl cis-trans isomerase C
MSIFRVTGFRVAGSAFLSAFLAVGAGAQTSVPVPAAPTAPPELNSNSPSEILARGFTNLNDLIAVLDQQSDNVAVTVEGQPVTDGEVADELRSYPATAGYMPVQSIYKLALENVMRQRALSIRARQAGTGKDPAVQRRIATATDRVLVAEYMRHEIAPKITDQALHLRYNSEIAGKSGALEAHVRVIKLSTRDEALDAKNALKANKDFADLARSDSRDPSTPSGGDLGWVSLDTIDPAIGSVAFSMDPGGVSTNPVRAAGGWFLIKNEGLRQQSAPSFEAARDRLRREIIAAEMAAIRGSIAANLTAPPGKIPAVDLIPQKK